MCGQQFRNSAPLEYCASVAILGAGLVYLFVPLYKLYCKQTGFAQSPQVKDEVRVTENGLKRFFDVKLTGTVEKALPWQFRPLTNHVRVEMGKPTLAFYRAKNLSSQEITGIATYNVLPQKAALYFNKIQCFCFEQQTLAPEEEVDMPVYFYVDPEIQEERGLKNLREIILSYSFFKSK